jgi:hypothetical protein
MPGREQVWAFLRISSCARGQNAKEPAIRPRRRVCPTGGWKDGDHMRSRRAVSIRAFAGLVASLVLAPKAGSGQTDEIQVYDAAIAGQAKFNLTWHNNFTPAGVRTPAFPGALVADKSLNSVTEWAYGVTDWFEAGLYLPLYSVGKRDPTLAAGAMVNGFKVRLVFVSPNADNRTFFYGANFEFSDNARHWDATRFTSEVRSIVGWHLHAFDIIVNPIVDTAYDGLKNLDFAPATRVAYNWTKSWTTALEEYDDFGPLHQFLPVGEQSHQLYGVVNHTTKALSIEAGVGFGLTTGADRWTLKLILSRDLN